MWQAGGKEKGGMQGRKMSTRDALSSWSSQRTVYDDRV